MMEMIKSKTMILFVIMILGTCFITALDNKKADTLVQENVDNNQTVLYK
jgi:hypothetical protein